MKPINVYLIAKIAEEYYERNEALCSRLDERFNVFIPHQHNPYNVPGNQMQAEVAQEDFRAIDNSQLALIPPPFGEDCWVEIGYCKGKEILSVLYVSEDPHFYGNENWLETWMGKEAIAAVAIENQSLMEIIQQDPILRHKPHHLMESDEGFSEFLEGLIAREQGEVQ